MQYSNTFDSKADNQKEGMKNQFCCLWTYKLVLGTYHEHLIWQEEQEVINGQKTIALMSYKNYVPIP